MSMVEGSEDSGTKKFVEKSRFLERVNKMRKHFPAITNPLTDAPFLAFWHLENSQ